MFIGADGGVNIRVFLIHLRILTVRVFPFSFAPVSLFRNLAQHRPGLVEVGFRGVVGFGVIRAGLLERGGGVPFLAVFGFIFIFGQCRFLLVLKR